MSSPQLIGGLEAGRLTTMISDTGPHPPEKWAEMAAREILIGEVKGDIPEHAQEFGKKVEALVFTAMTIALGSVRKKFDAGLDPEGAALDVAVRKSVELTTAHIVGAARGTPFANTTAESAARGHIPQVIGQRLTDTIHDHLQHWRQAVVETDLADA